MQVNNQDGDIDYVQYEKAESGFFWDHLNPQRLGVPRYQTVFRQLTWIIFLFGRSFPSWCFRSYTMEEVVEDADLVAEPVYSQSVQR